MSSAAEGESSTAGPPGTSPSGPFFSCAWILHGLSSQGPPPTCLNGPSKTQIRAGMVWAYLVLLYFVHTLPRPHPQIEGFWQPCIELVSQHSFPNSICSLPVSVSHFGHSCIISNPPPAKKIGGSLKAQMMVSIF